MAKSPIKPSPKKPAAASASVPKRSKKTKNAPRLAVVEKLPGIVKMGEEFLEAGHAAIKLQNLVARGNVPKRELNALIHELEDEIGDALAILDYFKSRNKGVLDEERIKKRRAEKLKRNRERTQPGVLTFETVE